MNHLEQTLESVVKKHALYAESKRMLMNKRKAADEKHEIRAIYRKRFDNFQNSLYTLLSAYFEYEPRDERFENKTAFLNKLIELVEKQSQYYRYLRGFKGPDQEDNNDVYLQYLSYHKRLVRHAEQTSREAALESKYPQLSKDDIARVIELQDEIEDLEAKIGCMVTENARLQTRIDNRIVNKPNKLERKNDVEQLLKLKLPEQTALKLQREERALNTWLYTFDISNRDDSARIKRNTEKIEETQQKLQTLKTTLAGITMVIPSQ